MKVVLLSPPYLGDYMRNGRCDYVSLSHSQWYPIWLGYCGALLEKHGHEVKLIDAPVRGLSHEATMEECASFSPGLTVVYSSLKSQESDIQFAEQVKARTGSKLVFVGPFVSINPRTILEQSTEVDWAVRREFDFPVLELAEGEPPEKVRNLLYRSGGGVAENEIRPLLTRAELDQFPFVSDFFRRHVDLHDYKMPQQLYPFIDMMTGRGCAWGRCTFCLWVHTFVPGPVYNTRSVENVIAELKFIKTEMPEVKEVMIQDDTLTTERARDISHAILDAKLDITWSCYTRGDTDYDTLVLMKRAGCRALHAGFESSNVQILKNVWKGTHPTVMKRFGEDAEKVGLNVHGDFMFGLPGETRESIQDTISWAKSVPITTAQFELINTYPGTPLHEYLRENNYLTAEGEPTYPHLGNEEIRQWAKRGFREFYFNWRYVKKVLSHPYDRFFTKMPNILPMICSLLWRRW